MTARVAQSDAGGTVRIEEHLPEPADSTVRNPHPSQGTAVQGQAESGASERKPIVTYALCVVCVIATASYLLPDFVPHPLWKKIGLLASPHPIDFWDGQYWGLLTSTFVHANIVHIAFNLSWLFSLGAAIELTIGWKRFLAFYVAVSVLSSGVQLAISGPGIGASGAVYGLFGLMWAGRFRYPAWQAYANSKNMQTFIVWGLFCVFTTWAGWMQIGNAAHASGLLVGLAVGNLLFVRPPRRLWAVPLALTAVLTALSLFWLPWNGYWNFWKANREFDRGRYVAAVTDYERSLRQGVDPSSCLDNIRAAWTNEANARMGRQDVDGAHKAFEAAAAASDKLTEFEKSSPVDLPR